MNIIDSLVVTLGLDGSGFARGAKQAQDTSGKLRENIVSDNNRQTDAAKKFQDGIRSVKTEALGLLLVLGGAASIKGFVGNIIAGDAATGRLANNLGIATEKLSAWEQAVQRVGGSKGDIDGTLSNLSNTYLNAKIRGNLGQSGELAGLGLNYGDLKDPTTALLKLADAKDRMSAPVYRNRLSALGIDQNTINLLEKGRGAVEAYLREAEKNGVVTQRNAEDAQRFESALSDLKNQIRGAARPQIEALADAFSGMAKDGKAAGAILPAIEGVIVAIGIAAGIAYAPVALLAGTITAAIVAWKDLESLQNMSADQRKEFSKRGERDRHKAWEDIKSGNIGSAISDLWDAAYGRYHANDASGAGAGATGGGGASGGGGGGGQASGNIEAGLVARGFSAEQARGIAAGIHAESGGNAGIVNSTSGAFGIGQWLGPRKAALFKRYGNHPSLEQQLDFLAGELRGGDRGGAAVMGARGSGAIGEAYITQFMRPKAGFETNRDLASVRNYLGGKRGGGASSSSQSTTITGGIIINTAATDARGIARDLPSALRERGIVYQTQTGVQP